MKQYIRNVIIWCIDTVGISFLYRLYRRLKQPLVRIIAFHDVQDIQWFETVIASIVKQYTVLSPEQFHTEQFDTEKINILLTFDDGYQSWLDVCVPVLARYQLKAIFFINSGLLDCEGDAEKVGRYMEEHLRISPKKALSWQGAQILLASGHTLGGHSVSHLDLATQADVQLEEEIVIDRTRITEKLHTDVVDFAYPFGTKKHYNEKVIQAVKKAGYTYQYSARTSFTAKGMLPQPRTLIEKGQSFSSINRWIKGGYDIFSRILRK